MARRLCANVHVVRAFRASCLLARSNCAWMHSSACICRARMDTALTIVSGCLDGNLNRPRCLTPRRSEIPPIPLDAHPAARAIDPRQLGHARTRPMRPSGTRTQSPIAKRCIMARFRRGSASPSNAQAQLQTESNRSAWRSRAQSTVRFSAATFVRLPASGNQADAPRSRGAGERVALPHQGSRWRGRRPHPERQAM